MNIPYQLYALTVILLTLQIPMAQIIEEIHLPVVEEVADSTIARSATTCVPPCRTGYFCNNGTCVSKCNPPCPDDMDCGDDGECHPRMTAIQQALNEIDEVTEVSNDEELVQGAVIRINRRNARVRVLEKEFKCNGELLLNVPKGDYDLYADAPGYFVNEEDLEVRPGMVDTIEIALRSFQIQGGIVFGGASIEDFSLLAGEINLGIGLFTKLYLGITATYIGPVFTTMTEITEYDNPYIPDTLKEEMTELMGIGVSFGWFGIPAIARKIKLIPQIAVGNWKYDEQTYFYSKLPEEKEQELKNMERHSIENYSIRPILAVRIGEKVFNFEARVSAFFGSGTPVVTAMAGFQVAVPR